MTEPSAGGRGEAQPAIDPDVDGPFDIGDFDDPAQAEVARLNLGSVLIPAPETGQLQVELTETGVPSAVWVITPNGRFTIAAYAAPKSTGLWREVAAELSDALRKDRGEVSIEMGPWGREVVGSGENGVVRFIGIDGYRWMIRCVVNGTEDTIDVLATEARKALADTVVSRGDTPLPVRPPRKVSNRVSRRSPRRAAPRRVRRCSSCARRWAAPRYPRVVAVKPPLCAACQCCVVIDRGSSVHRRECNVVAPPGKFAVA